MVQLDRQGRERAAQGEAGALSEEELAAREARRLARKARRRASRRETILDAAREVIIDEGLAFTMDKVAAGADVSKPALYYYFRSKESLIGALAVEVLRVEAETFDADVAGG